MAEKVKAAGRSHWIILVLLALAQFMVVLDVSIVNVALPAIQKAFNMSETNLQWIVSAYTLAFGGCLLLGGRMADLFGRRRTFLLGIAGFTLFSLGAGLSQSEGMIIAFRALQGLAGALMSPAALSIVLVTYNEGHERNVALSVWGAVASGGAAAGVLLGGVLTEYLNWRWNFMINVPVGLLVIATSLRILDKHESESDHNNLDLPGAVLVTGGLMTLVYGLTKAPDNGWGSTSSLVAFGIAIAALVAFVINETRIAKHPLIPFSIFKIRNLSGADGLMMLMTASMFSVFFFLTLYIQQILGFSPVKTGLAFLPIPIAIAIVATNVPRVIQRIGFKPILMVAPLLTAAGLFYLSYISVGGTYLGDVLPGTLLMGLGMGATFVAVSIAATSGVPRNEAGLASGLLNTSQQLGGALGLAILSGVAITGSKNYITDLGTRPSAAQIAAGTVHGYHNGFLVAACFAVAASIVATLVLKEVRGTAGQGEGIPAGTGETEPAVGMH